MRPLRLIQRKLREIRYYSATRQSSTWNRILDVAVGLALVAAWPLTWSFDRGVIDRRIHAIVTGKLYGLADGAVWGATTAALGPGIVPTGATPYGAFDLMIVTDRGGWPFTSSASPRRPVLKVETYVPRQTLTLNDLPAGAPLRETIAKSLSKTKQDSALGSLGSSTPADLSMRMRVRGWFGNIVVLSLGLAFLAWLAAGMARLLCVPFQGRHLNRKVARASSGQCTACGYDLQGNPFGSHCPECGAVV